MPATAIATGRMRVPATCRTAARRIWASVACGTCEGNAVRGIKRRGRGISAWFYPHRVRSPPSLFRAWFGVGGVPSPREAGAARPETSGVRAPRPHQKAPRPQNSPDGFGSNAPERASGIFTRNVAGKRFSFALWRKSPCSRRRRSRAEALALASEVAYLGITRQRSGSQSGG